MIQHLLQQYHSFLQFCNWGRRCRGQVDFLSISRKKLAKQKHNYFQNLTEVVDFSKPFIATKQAKQNESNLILLQ